MKKYIFLSIICAIMCSCLPSNFYSTIENPPTNPGIAQPKYDDARAGFSTRRYQGGLTVTFTDYSIGARIVYYFGDGTSQEFNPGKLQKLTEKEFTHTYKKKKTYTVTVKAFGMKGDEDTYYTNVKVW